MYCKKYNGPENSILCLKFGQNQAERIKLAIPVQIHDSGFNIEYIENYEESMTEYPPGCVLAIKEVFDSSLIVPGKDYTIETSEFLVTRQIQFIREGYITCYSSNKSTYGDGQMVHAPFDIPIDSIIKISSVLGYMVRKDN